MPLSFRSGPSQSLLAPRSPLGRSAQGHQGVQAVDSRYLLNLMVISSLFRCLLHVRHRRRRQGVPQLRSRSHRSGASGLDLLNLLVISCLSGHLQVVQDGYELFANRKLVTLFSAPHYCGQFDNAAAVLLVNAQLECSFKVLISSLLTDFFRC
jgi:hypothetical protein